MNRTGAIFIPARAHALAPKKEFPIFPSAGINAASPRYTQVKVMRSSGAGTPKNIARAAPPPPNDVLQYIPAFACGAHGRNLYPTP